MYMYGGAPFGTRIMYGGAPFGARNLSAVRNQEAPACITSYGIFNP